MPRIALALEERGTPEAVLDFLEALAGQARNKGCKLASPAQGSWLIAACSQSLLVTYPGPTARPSSTEPSAAKITIIIVIEGPPHEIVELANLVLETARARKLPLTPIIL